MSNDTSSAGRGPRREPDKEKFWRRTLLDFAHSGQSIRAFCRQQQLSEPSFYAWRRTLAQRNVARRAGRVSKAAAPAAPAFLPIRLADENDAIEIALDEGHCIRLRPPIDRGALVEILAALRTSGTAEG